MVFEINRPWSRLQIFSYGTLMSTYFKNINQCKIQNKLFTRILLNVYLENIFSLPSIQSE